MSCAKCFEGVACADCIQQELTNWVNQPGSILKYKGDNMGAVKEAAVEVMETHEATLKKLAESEQQEGAKKNDQGKLEWHLLPESALIEVLKVFQMGKNKYGDFNWKKSPGFEWTRLHNSLQRHRSAWLSGQDYDQESGLPELAHLAANALMLLTYHVEQLGVDNRPVVKPKKSKVTEIE